MAALGAAFNGWRLVPGTGLRQSEGNSSGTLTFFRGALAHIAAPGGAGKLIINNPDTAEFFGIVERQTVATVDVPIPCWIGGVVWLTGCAQLTFANMAKPMGALAGSDNPADILPQATPNPGALGRLLNVEVTAVSGYLDISDRSALVNA